MEPSRILVIGVIFNSYPEALRYTISLTPFLCNSVDIILVDNSTNWDPHFQKNILTLTGNITYLRTPINLGYFGGVRYGIAHSKRAPESYAWTIIGNVDMVIEDAYFFERLRVWENQKDVGIIAPAIISVNDGRNLSLELLRKPSYAKMKIRERIFLNRIFSNVYALLSFIIHRINKYIKIIQNNKIRISDTINIYAPHGSFIILNQRFFRFGGTLNNPSFLFGEEFFLAEESIKIGLNVYYDPSLQLKHYDHTSTGLIQSKQVAKYMHKALMDILRNYY